MAGIPKKRDYELELLQEIEHKSKCQLYFNPDHNCSITELAMNLNMSPNKVIEKIKSLVNKKLVVKKIDKTYPYYVINSKIKKNHFSMVKDWLGVYQKQLEFRINKISTKEIFKNIAKPKSKTNKFPKFRFNERIVNEYDVIIFQINQMINIASTLPFAQSLELIPKNADYDKEIQHLQNEINDKVISFINKLCNDHKKHKKLIREDLKLKIPVFNHLQSFIPQSTRNLREV